MKLLTIAAASVAALSLSTANAWWGPGMGGFPGANYFSGPTSMDTWTDMFGDVDTSFRTTGWGRGRGTGYTHPHGYGYGYPGYGYYGYGAPAYGAPVAPMGPAPVAPAAPAAE